MKKFIWLIGENLGNSASNNSYFFWRRVVEQKDEIEKYFVLAKTKQNEAFCQSLPEEIRKFVLWKNSPRHFQLYLKADMFFVTLSYRDVRPENLFGKKYNFLTETPVIYLQHGTLAMKKLGYNGKDYNNNMFRFVYYNSQIKPVLMEQNGFKGYQLYDGQFHPRYQGTILRNDESQGEKKKLLWFFTWREYMGNNLATKIFFMKIEQVLSNPKLQTYLEEKGYTLEICFHNQFDLSRINEIFDNIHCPNICWSYAGNISVVDALVDCKMLITDYSSIGFDVTLLNKPVLLFLPDLDEYTKKRSFYCDMEELLANSIRSSRQLVDTIVSEDYGVSPFFRSRMPENIDYDYIRQGKHIDRMYEDFARIQRNKITFLGYNFYGIGGTVLATRAMAEALLERGYLLELRSLKQTKLAGAVPYALNMKSFYHVKSKGITDRLKKLVRGKQHFEFLKYDKDLPNLIPYVGYGLKKWLASCNSRTVISTRESLHPFLHAYASDAVENKVFYFHCSPTVFDDIFPNLTDELKKFKAEKAVFVTENNRVAFLEKYGFEPYEKYAVLGNPLDSSRMITRDQIQAVEEKDVYRGMYLLRLSKDRATDIENLLGYGRYLRDHNISDIVIDVFGAGDYVDDFLRIIIAEELTDYIHYCGRTTDPKAEFVKHDAVVDFSVAHSFGMPYIEGVLNGKMVFCMKNPGSEEVMAGIPDAYIESYEDLTRKIRSLPKYTVEDLTRNYDILSAKYSREALSQGFVRFLED